MRLRKSPGPRARLARLPCVPLLALAAWFAIGMVATLALLDLVTHRAARVQDERDTVWIALMKLDALKAELVRPARNMLDDALAGSDPARIDWRQPAEGGLLVAVDDVNGLRLLSRPPGFDPAGQPLPRLVRSIQDTRDPLPVGDSYCLPLPGADVARMALRRGATVTAAACFGTEAIGRAAQVVLPRTTELTFWRDRRGLVRVNKGKAGEAAVGAAPATLDRAVLDQPEDGIELSLGPIAGLQLLARGGSTVGNLQVVEEPRAGDPALVYYVGRTRQDATGWTGFSISFGESPPAPSPVPAWAAGLLALHFLVLPALALWSWRVLGRLTRRWQGRR